MSHTFRHSSSAKMAVPFVIILVLILVLMAVTTGRSSGACLSWIILGGLAALWAVIKMGAVLWGAYVRVDEGGVTWSEGGNQGFLTWANIDGLGSTANRSRLEVGLIEKGTSQLRVLPLINRELYEILRSRVGALPKSEEGELYNRWGG